MTNMTSTVSAREAKNKFGQLIESAQCSPVTITKNGRPSVVVVSVIDYERRRKKTGEKFISALKRAQMEAGRNGIKKVDIKKLVEDDD